MEGEMYDKEKEILEFLKKNGRSFTSQVSFGVRCNPHYAKFYLEELEKKGLVIRIEKKSMKAVRTLWELKSK